MFSDHLSFLRNLTADHLQIHESSNISDQRQTKFSLTSAYNIIKIVPLRDNILYHLLPQPILSSFCPPLKVYYTKNPIYKVYGNSIFEKGLYRSIEHAF